MPVHFLATDDYFMEAKTELPMQFHFFGFTLPGDLATFNGLTNTFKTRHRHPLTLPLPHTPAHVCGCEETDSGSYTNNYMAKYLHFGFGLCTD